MFFSEFIFHCHVWSITQFSAILNKPDSRVFSETQGNSILFDGSISQYNCKCNVELLPSKSNNRSEKVKNNPAQGHLKCRNVSPQFDGKWFKSDVFTLKRINCYPFTLRRWNFGNAAITGRSVWILSLWKTRAGRSQIIVMSSFSKSSVFKMFPSTLNRKVGVFKFLGLKSVSEKLC